MDPSAPLAESVLTKLSADVLFALALAAGGLTMLRLAPALRVWIEARAVKRRGEAVERLNGKLVDAIRLALADSVPFQRLIDDRVSRKVTAAATSIERRFKNVEDAQEALGNWQGQAIESQGRLAVVEAEVRSLRETMSQQREDLDKLEARMLAQIQAMQAAQTTALVTEIRAMHRSNFERMAGDGNGGKS